VKIKGLLLEYADIASFLLNSVVFDIKQGRGSKFFSHIHALPLLVVIYLKSFLYQRYFREKTCLSCHFLIPFISREEAIGSAHRYTSTARSKSNEHISLDQL